VSVRIMIGDVRAKLAEMPDESVHCVVTSPPYFGLRDYGVDGQIGLEPTPADFVAVMVDVFREARRVLRVDGTLWLNLGDSYAGSGRGAWDIPDEEKTRRGVKETYRPNKRAGGTGITGIGDSAKQAAVMKGAGMDRNMGLKPKDLIGIPWRVAFALQDDGWYLRQDIIWSKPNPMPESVTDRCTKAHEYLFLLSKSARYHYDAEAIAEPLTDSSIARLSQDIDAQQGSDRVPGKTNGTKKAVSARDNFRRENSKRAFVHPGQSVGTHRPDREDTIPGVSRNKRSVWTVATQPYSEAHFATFPPALIEPCILAGCPKGGTVLDPFGGAGTTGLVADRLGRNAILIELNPEYAAIAERRIKGDCPMFAEVV